MAYEVVMSYHLHMPSYFLGTFTEYPYLVAILIPKSSIKFEYIPYHKISLLFLTIWYHRVQLASIAHELDYINFQLVF